MNEYRLIKNIQHFKEKYQNITNEEVIEDQVDLAGRIIGIRKGII